MRARRHNHRAKNDAHTHTHTHTLAAPPTRKRIAFFVADFVSPPGSLIVSSRWTLEKVHDLRAPGRFVKDIGVRFQQGLCHTDLLRVQMLHMPTAVQADVEGTWCEALYSVSLFMSMCFVHCTLARRDTVPLNRFENRLFALKEAAVKIRLFCNSQKQANLYRRAFGAEKKRVRRTQSPCFVSK